jgi:hypothetical protein
MPYEPADYNGIMGVPPAKNKARDGAWRVVVVVVVRDPPACRIRKRCCEFRNENGLKHVVPYFDSGYNMTTTSDMPFEQVNSFVPIYPIKHVRQKSYVCCKTPNGYRVGVQHGAVRNARVNSPPVIYHYLLQPSSLEDIRQIHSNIVGREVSQIM